MPFFSSFTIWKTERKGTHQSSVTPTPTLTEQWWQQLTSTGYLWHALLCPKYTKLYRPYHVTMAMLLASLTDEKEPQRANSSSIMLCSYKEVTMGICSHQCLVWEVGFGGGLLLHSPRRKPKNLLHPVHKAFLTHGGGIWCCRELTVIHGDWVGSHLGMSSMQTPLWFLSLEFCVLLPDWFSTQTLIDHSTRVEREDWINPSKASLDR